MFKTPLSTACPTHSEAPEGHLRLIKKECKLPERDPPHVVGMQRQTNLRQPLTELLPKLLGVGAVLEFASQMTCTARVLLVRRCVPHLPPPSRGRLNRSTSMFWNLRLSIEP